MHKFSAVSQMRLDTAHIDLQLIFKRVLPHFDHSILCGHRSKPDQEACHRAGNSQLQWPESKHNSSPSRAIDAAPWDQYIRNIDWKDKKRMYYLAGHVRMMAIELLEQGKITHKLRYGGDWDGDTHVLDEKFRDLVHWELIPNEDEEGSVLTLA